MPIRDSVDPAASAELDKQGKLASAKEGLSDNISAPWYAGPAVGNAADAVTTLGFLKEGGTEQGASGVIGHHPSPAAVVGLKAAEALIAEAGIRAVAKKSKTAAKILSLITTAAPAKAALGNIGYTKKLRARNKDVGGKR